MIEGFIDNLSEVYREAQKQGKRDYLRHKAKGESGHLTSLDGLLKDLTIVANVHLGIKEVRLSRVVGTYYQSRRTMFSRGFLPLESEHTEFGQKWMNLYKVHIVEGIRDPIKVYEYFNYYYVVEGNKRVSVLKWLDAHAITAEITRLVPQYDADDEDVVNYYAFLDFYKETGINDLWLSKPRRFDRLKDLLMAYEPGPAHFMKWVYGPFRKHYLDAGGQSLNMTTADAFLLYAKLYGLPQVLDEKQLLDILPNLLKELSNYGDTEELEIKTQADVIEKAGIFTSLSSWLTNKKLKIGFVYARTIENSGWTYAHDLGRSYLEAHFGDQVQTAYIENVSETDPDSAYEAIKTFASDGFDIVFTTSEVFRRPTLKCAMELERVRFFNCSENRPYLHMSNYYGRTYEPRFLTGLIAGAITKSHVIGYTATAPNPEVLSSINAFYLGMRMVNPRARLLVLWTGEWNNPKLTTDLSKVFVQFGADLVSNKTLSVARNVTQEYGVYAMLCTVDTSTGEPQRYLAAPLWNWGVFYEKIVNSVLTGSYQRMIASTRDVEKPHHFWWGMDAGALDIYVDQRELVPETLRLVEHMKSSIIQGSFNPFCGPLLDHEGNLRCAKGDQLQPEDILAMDWLLEGIEIINHDVVSESSIF